jgi:hypothetical protein
MTELLDSESATSKKFGAVGFPIVAGVFEVAE